MNGHSVQVQLVSVGGERAQVERGLLRLRSTDKFAEIVLETPLGVSSDPGLRRQLSQARAIAGTVLTQHPWVRRCAVATFDRSDVVLSMEGATEFTGDSFGLSLLVGILSLGLGTECRKEHLFSAGLPNPQALTETMGVDLPLQAVSDVRRKLNAATAAGGSRFFVACDEGALLGAERDYWAGRPEQSCLPVAISPDAPLPVGAVIGLGVNLEPVFARLGQTPDSALLAAYVLFGAARSARWEAAQPCIGECLAACRSAGILDRLELDDPGSWPLLASTSIEASLWRSGLQAMRTCPDDNVRRTLLKALLSRHPSAPVVPLAGDRDQKSDVENWTASLSDNRHPPEQVLEILSALRHIPHDSSAIEALVLPWMTSHFDSWLDSLATAFRCQDVPLCNLQMESLGRVFPRAVRYNPDLARLILGQFDSLAARVSGSERELALLLWKVADAYRHLDLDQTHRAALSDSKEHVEIIFRRELWAAGEADPVSGLVPLTDLAAEFRVGTHTRFVVAGPVLLFEEPNRVSETCRRRSYRTSDRTLSRFTAHEAAVVTSLFASEISPTRIGFQVRAENPPAIVRWPPMTFPPAIDTILLLATLCRHGVGLNPRTLLDAGCGTGLLALAAAQLWPTLEQLDLVDVDAYTVKVAELNARAASLNPRLAVRCRAADLANEPAAHVDVLIANPPYLPERTVPVRGIELATNGTRLLKALLRNHAPKARDTYLVCSALAWPEVEGAIQAAGDSLGTVELLSRAVVPFRLPWLEPDPASPSFRANLSYYENLLAPRGLLDLDSGSVPYANPMSETSIKRMRDLSAGQEAFERLVDLVLEHSRGFRYWHEIRVLHVMAPDVG